MKILYVVPCSDINSLLQVANPVSKQRPENEDI